MFQVMLPALTRDGWLLFLTRGLRMFAFGLLSVALVVYLGSLGYDTGWAGVLITLSLVGDIALSLAITTAADRVGRRRMLLVGAVMMLLAGVVFAVTSNWWLLLAAATIGVLAPSDKEVGPFLSIEQACLAETTPAEERTHIFAWYNLTGSLAAALGTLAAGHLLQFQKDAGATGPDIYLPLLWTYSGVGGLLLILFLLLGPDTEARPRKSEAPGGDWLGLHQSHGVVFALSALFALDAFGGGFLMQSLVASWFQTRFQVTPATLGNLLFAANLLAAASALAASWIAARIGLLNTMVFTHLPSNVLLILVPLMPTLDWAMGLFLARFAISQMDVPTRQSYTMAVVAPDERSAAAGVTTVARSVGGAAAPAIAGFLLADPRLMALPFILAGGIKIVYDLLLYRAFMTHETKHE
jgi:MFS family permease